MTPKEYPQQLDQIIGSVDDLVLLRTSVEIWAEQAQDAVLGFLRSDGSFSKESDVTEETRPPHITTTARAYIALSYADRIRDTKRGRQTPKWQNDFKKFVGRPTVGRANRYFCEAIGRDDQVPVTPHEFNSFDIAHLADFYQVSRYLDRFHNYNEGVESFFSRKSRCHGNSPPESAAELSSQEYSGLSNENLISRRLREFIEEAASANSQQARFPGEVCFEQGRPDSRHYFATLHVLRALHVLEQKEIKGIEEVVAGARSFATEQCYYFQRGTRQHQDPVRLAFAGCIYAIYDEHADQDLCLAIVEALSEAQQENGSWPATHPIIRNKNTPWHIASHEVALCLGWLYFQPRMPDVARPLIIGMMRKYFLNAVIPSFVKGSRNGKKTNSGWKDDHTISSNKTLGWATAIVCHFLSIFSNSLTDWINRRVIEELGLQLATKGYLIDDTASTPSVRWAASTIAPHVWPDLPPHGWLAKCPDNAEVQKRIEDKWTDPSYNAMISKSLAKNVIAHIHSNPSEQPKSDRCSGLLPGSPGTRKTSLVKQVADEIRWPMVAVPAASIFEDGFDKMEARANRVFRLLNHLRGCVIFFDEFEEFFLTRGENDDSEDAQKQSSDAYKSRTIAAFTTSSMLPRLQDLHDQCRSLIFLATNYLEKIDPAIKRPGRFDFLIRVEHPNNDRIFQYIENLTDGALRSTGLNSVDAVERKEIVDAVKAAITSVSDYQSTEIKEGAAVKPKPIKFAIVEQMLRQVRKYNEKALPDQAKHVLDTQLKSSDGDNPPDLEQL